MSKLGSGIFAHSQELLAKLLHFSPHVHPATTQSTLHRRQETTKKSFCVSHLRHTSTQETRQVERKGKTLRRQLAETASVAGSMDKTSQHRLADSASSTGRADRQVATVTEAR